MAENSGFFASVGGDRKYNMDFLARWVASFIGNGVYDGELAVTADGSTMSVTLPSGRAWINGYYYHNDGDMTFAIANADGVLNRKDTVVLRWDVNARSITTQVLTGTFSSSPIAPQITRSAEQYDLKIAEISIPAGTTAITQSLITDTRLDNDVCGIVTGVVKQVDTTALYQQIQDDLAQFRSENEAGFEEWFQGIRDMLDEDAAGHLQNEIDAHVNNADIHVTPSQNSAIDTAVQSIKFGGTSATKSGTEVDIPFGLFNINDVVSAPYTDADDENLFTTGYYDCSNVISSNPFGSSPSGNITPYMLLVTIANHDQDMSRNIFQIAIRKSDGCVKIRSIGPDDFTEGWFPQNDDGTGLKHYTKYADGRLHEWGFQVGDITVTSAYGNMFLYSHYNINLLNHCTSNVSCYVNICSTGGTLVGVGATLKYGTDNVLDFNVLSPASVTNITATFMYDVWSRWK